VTVVVGLPLASEMPVTACRQHLYGRIATSLEAESSIAFVCASTGRELRMDSNALSFTDRYFFV
jgi:hypothetical protein